MSRRRLAASAAWLTPTIMVGAATPAAAASVVTECSPTYLSVIPNNQNASLVYPYYMSYYYNATTQTQTLRFRTTVPTPVSLQPSTTTAMNQWFWLANEAGAGSTGGSGQETDSDVYHGMPDQTVNLPAGSATPVVVTRGNAVVTATSVSFETTIQVPPGYHHTSFLFSSNIPCDGTHHPAVIEMIDPTTPCGTIDIGVTANCTGGS